MALKNYSTSIDAGKTCGEIEAILARAGASRIMKEYDNGLLSSMSFMLRVSSAGLEMEVPYRLPLRSEAIFEVLKKQYAKGKLPRSFCTQEQAVRVGWRIIKDWVDAQTALIEIGCAKMEEVFLPYMFSFAQNKTFYQIAKEGGMHNLLPPPTQGATP